MLADRTRRHLYTVNQKQTQSEDNIILGPQKEPLPIILITETDSALIVLKQLESMSFVATSPRFSQIVNKWCKFSSTDFTSTFPVKSDAGFICRRWLESNARMKQLFEGYPLKWTEQTIKRLSDPKSLLCLSLRLACRADLSAIPFCRFEPSLHPSTRSSYLRRSRRKNGNLQEWIYCHTRVRAAN